MFTGLIEAIGQLEAVRPLSKGGGNLEVKVPEFASQLSLGESVAVNGVCLTVTGKQGDRFLADYSASTLEVTTLGSWHAGHKVNLERAMALGDRLGGHMVTGHVDTVAHLQARRLLGEAIRLDFSLAPTHARQLVTKGSVAVDGISLTVNGVSDEGFWVTVIPHTGERTTLLSLPRGAAVNLETDLLGKYVERQLAGRLEAAGGLTMEGLARSGF